MDYVSGAEVRLVTLSHPDSERYKKGQDKTTVYGYEAALKKENGNKQIKSQRPRWDTKSCQNQNGPPQDEPNLKIQSAVSEGTLNRTGSHQQTILI
ncbi:hypothetical protein RUM43_008297 [Polyplax serrata]|uniref:Uncharacterized protein n=1 Tax=Polyplax serrata TaxID=468196 RepID=A0AAN8S617_POLSC